MAGNFVTDRGREPSRTPIAAARVRAPSSRSRLQHRLRQRLWLHRDRRPAPNTDPGFLGRPARTRRRDRHVRVDRDEPGRRRHPAREPPAAPAATSGGILQRLQNGFCDMGGYNLFEPEEGRPFTPGPGVRGSDQRHDQLGRRLGGSPPARSTPSTGQVTGTHTYALAGDYDGTMSWTNSDPGLPRRLRSSSRSRPRPWPSRRFRSAPSGRPVQRPVATFTDGDPNFGTGNFTAEINWGDDSASAGGTITQGASGFTVSGTHTYKNADTFKMSVTVSCADGSRRPPPKRSRSSRRRPP